MFSIFKAHQIDLLHDKGSLFFILVFPLLMVFILGSMLGSLDNPDEEIEPLTIAYLVETDEPVARATVDALLEEFDEGDRVSFAAESDLALVEQKLERGELSAAVVFKQPFEIEIHDGVDGIQNRAVHAIFESVARIQGTTMVLVGLTAGDGTEVTKGDGTILSPKATSRNSQTGDKIVPSPFVTPRVEEKVFGISRSMIDYYAVTMIVMMFFMGSAGAGAAAIYGGRKDGSLRRTLASPLSRTSIYLQLVLSQVPFNLVQVGVVMITTTTFFGAHYAATWQLNVLLFVMLSFAGLACSALSLLVGIVIRVQPQLVIMPLMWPMLFLAGTFSKPISIPGLSEYLPPALIQQAAFDLTLFGQSERSLAVLLVSAGIFVLATLAGTALFKRKAVAE